MSHHRKDEAPPPPEPIDAAEEDDTEAHSMLRMDLGTARETARLRRAEIERDLRDRQQAKEARPRNPRG